MYVSVLLFFDWVFVVFCCRHVSVDRELDIACIVVDDDVAQISANAGKANLNRNSIQD